MIISAVVSVRSPYWFFKDVGGGNATTTTDFTADEFGPAGSTNPHHHPHPARAAALAIFVVKAVVFFAVVACGVGAGCVSSDAKANAGAEDDPLLGSINDDVTKTKAAESGHGHGHGHGGGGGGGGGHGHGHGGGSGAVKQRTGSTFSGRSKIPLGNQNSARGH